ncbi:MAG: hypothetical protein HC915_10535, partial [Anaerolineae bacterium]|nr:hypothetical protein [Anaerolineae bacterium]
MPLLLGDRLEKTVQSALISGLERFLTEHGLASENPASPFYTPDGYWRGPIWAPSTYLLVEGLRACGADGLAQEVATRFCALAA